MTSRQRATMTAVSIHARHCCRANPACSWPPRACTSMFQSTPGIAAGRILAKLEFMRASTDVSIHARHCCRANRIAKHKEAEAAKVSIHARHCCRANRHDVSLENSAKVFQSTPGIAAGRIADTLRDDYKLLYVSIHARHCCRANHGRDSGFANLAAVSIHARHCCRANRWRA